MKNLMMVAALVLASTSAFAGEANVNTTANMTNANEWMALTGITRGKGCTPEGDYIQWQCGGRPSGAGWVRVSPTCYHRSIGHC
jgi:hypothetical protein